MIDAEFFVRDSVRQMVPYNAGLTLDDIRARGDLPRIAKLGSNENLAGPSPAVKAALAQAFDTVHLYPDPTGRELRTALAGRFGVSADRVMLGNGSEDLLSVICRGVLRPGDEVLTLFPSFPLHEDYSALMDARVKRVKLRRDLGIDVDALVDALSQGPRLAMFANPMNPVGSWLNPAEMARVIDALKPQTLLVVDEAYAEYAAGDDYPEAPRLLAGSGKAWISLRTFSKAWGLAGLRIGYGVVGEAALAGFLDRVRTPFNTNRAAQVAALAALAHASHVEEIVALARAERERMRRALESRNLRVAPSKGNFLFFDCGQDASVCAQRLLRRGVIVKPWKQEGYETFVRVSVGMPEDNDQFLAALASP